MGDEFYALKLGPDPSQTYDGLKVAQGTVQKALPSIIQDFFKEHVVVDDNNVIVSEEVDTSYYLSESAIECLDVALAAFSNLTTEQLVDQSHQEDAWSTAWSQTGNSASQVMSQEEHYSWWLIHAHHDVIGKGKYFITLYPHELNKHQHVCPVVSSNPNPKASESALNAQINGSHYNPPLRKHLYSMVSCDTLSAVYYNKITACHHRIRPDDRAEILNLIGHSRVLAQTRKDSLLSQPY